MARVSLTLALAGLIAVALAQAAPADSGGRRPGSLAPGSAAQGWIPAPTDAKPPPARSKCVPGNATPDLCEVVPVTPAPSKPGTDGSKKPGTSREKKPGGSQGPNQTAGGATQPEPARRPVGPSSPVAPTPGGPESNPEGLPDFPVSLAPAALKLLIGSFPVPPFLLPIYHAAGVDYGVPWQILAAINELETDYGRNLSTSSAGAVGWMQFLPSTWARFGIDADGDGVANPYDPVDAIFSAARYLRAAGLQRSLSNAIFAYNHAGWYVSSVELRAKLLEFYPRRLADVLTGLMQARFPVGGHLGRNGTDVSKPTSVAGHAAIDLGARPHAPVVAVADGRVVRVGQSGLLGKYVTIEDSYGNGFTYSRLGRIASVIPVLKPRVQSALRLAGRLGAATTGVSAASMPAATRLLPRRFRPIVQRLSPARAQAPAVLAKERLFAVPYRPASYAAGGRLQLESSLRVDTSTRAGALSWALHPGSGQFTSAPLARGAIVAAGTVLGRVGSPRDGTASVTFQIRPVGARTPVDPGPIVASWAVLGRLTTSRQALVGANQWGAFGASNPSLGQVLMASKSALGRDVLSDPRLAIGACGRHDIETGAIDRRVLAVIEYLSYSGLTPGISRWPCGSSRSAARPRPQLDITRLQGIPVAGHQQDGGIVDLTIRRLLGLQGALHPTAVVSLRSYPGQPSAISLPDHAARLEVDFSPSGSPPNIFEERMSSSDWERLIGRLAVLVRPTRNVATAHRASP